MKTKVIDWLTIADWIEKADKPGEDMVRLLDAIYTELQVAVLLVGHAATTARLRERKESTP